MRSPASVRLLLFAVICLPAACADAGDNTNGATPAITTAATTC